VSVVANVAINVDSRNAVSKLRQVQTQSQATERAVEGLSRAFGGLAAAFGAGFALTKVIADVRELDTNLRRLGTVGVDVGKISPALSALSKELGGVASKAELAAASYQAASAGFSDTAGNINILRAATKAATGGLADTQAVTEVLVKTLNSYGLAGDQATKVTDSISKAVELGNQEWSDYTSQLGRVASIAALAGVSLDEVNAFIASATKNGATAEIAFTGLGATLNTLLQPTKESQEAAAKLGIAWNYGGLQAKGFTGLMAELAIAMEKDKETTAKLLGSQEAMRGAFAANAKGGRDYKMVLEELSGATGKTDADFQILKVSLDNQLKALDTAFKNLSEALGTAFGPTVATTISDVATAINAIADALNAVPQPLKSATAEAAKFVIQMLLVQKAIQAIIGLRAAFIAAMVGVTTATAASGTAAKVSAGSFALYTANTRALQAQAATATPVLAGLKNILSSLAAIGIITVAVNIAVSGFQNLLAAKAELDKLSGRKAAGGAAAMFKGSTKEEVIRQQQIAKKTKQFEKKTLANLQSPGSRTAQFLNLGGVLEGFGVPSINSAGQRELQANARIKSAEAVLGLDPTKFRSAVPIATGGGGGGGGGDDDTAGGKSKKGKDDAERKAEEKRRAAEELANLQGQVALKEKLFAIDKQIAVEKERGSLVTAAALEMDKALEERQARIAEITRSTVDQATKNAQIKDATLDADQKIYAVQQAIKEQEIERTKAFDQTIADLNLELALKTATTEQAREQLRLEAEIARISGDKNLTPDQQQAIIGRKTELARPKTDKERLQGAADEVKLELEKLTDPINLVTNAATGIGDAFATSFKGIISGSMTAKEALAGFFQSVADQFLDMAAQIIAKWIQMTILNTVLRLFPGGDLVGGIGGGLSSGFNAGTASAVPTDAGGWAASFGTVLPGRAKGGPVSGGQMYMVGERGPELFVPGRSGTIVPNDKMGGGSTNVVVNVDAKGSSVEGNEQGANQLGRVISAAVQSELIKQQRPGGLLAR
jgi:TP901 family phage tail tape measure protein